MQPMLNIAIRAARRAGDFIVRKINRLPEIDVETKASNDFVSEVDRGAEARIIEELSTAYPDHGILAEESGELNPGSEFRWIVDPLDGTTNYLRGIPHFAVSIGCERAGRLTHGVIYDPIKQELFCASRGDGATLNNKRIRVSGLRSLDSALLATGLPFRNPAYLDEAHALLKRFCRAVGDIRRPGSAALDLAYVAAGRFDGFWEANLHPWDLAAGALIVREAGGLVTDFDGEEHFLDQGRVVCANPKLVTAMLKVIREHREA